MMCSNNGELLDEYIGVAFDGTTRLGEAINTTARWCPKDLKIKMRLIDFTTLKCAPAHPPDPYPTLPEQVSHLM